MAKRKIKVYRDNVEVNIPEGWLPQWVSSGWKTTKPAESRKAKAVKEPEPESGQADE